jgi:hypothetical protein
MRSALSKEQFRFVVAALMCKFGFVVAALIFKISYLKAAAKSSASA